MQIRFNFPAFNSFFNRFFHLGFGQFFKFIKIEFHQSIIIAAIRVYKRVHVFDARGQLVDNRLYRGLYFGFADRFPFKVGYAATVTAVEGDEDSRSQAATALQVQEVFVIFEIAVFSAIGLALSGWRLWIMQMFWPLVILLALYLFVRHSDQGNVSGAWRAKWAAFRTMAQAPSTLVKLALIGLLAFLADDITPYLTAQAFSSDNVLLLSPFLVIQAGVVGGYIASRIPVSPGAIGQYEWGFATALLVSN